MLRPMTHAASASSSAAASCRSRAASRMYCAERSLQWCSGRIQHWSTQTAGPSHRAALTGNGNNVRLHSSLATSSTTSTFDHPQHAERPLSLSASVEAADAILQHLRDVSNAAGGRRNSSSSSSASSLSTSHTSSSSSPPPHGSALRGLYRHGLVVEALTLGHALRKAGVVLTSDEESVLAACAAWAGEHVVPSGSPLRALPFPEVKAVPLQHQNEEEDGFSNAFSMPRNSFSPDLARAVVAGHLEHGRIEEGINFAARFNVEVPAEGLASLSSLSSLASLASSSSSSSSSSRGASALVDALLQGSTSVPPSAFSHIAAMLAATASSPTSFSSPSAIRRLHDALEQAHAALTKSLVGHLPTTASHAQQAAALLTSLTAAIPLSPSTTSHLLTAAALSGEVDIVLALVRRLDASSHMQCVAAAAVRHYGAGHGKFQHRHLEALAHRAAVSEEEKGILFLQLLQTLQPSASSFTLARVSPNALWAAMWSLSAAGKWEEVLRVAMLIVRRQAGLGEGSASLQEGGEGEGGRNGHPNSGTSYSSQSGRRGGSFRDRDTFDGGDYLPRAPTPASASLLSRFWPTDSASSAQAFSPPAASPSLKVHKVLAGAWSAGGNTSSNDLVEQSDDAEGILAPTLAEDGGAVAAPASASNAHSPLINHSDANLWQRTFSRDIRVLEATLWALFKLGRHEEVMEVWHVSFPSWRDAINTYDRDFRRARLDFERSGDGLGAPFMPGSMRGTLRGVVLHAVLESALTTSNVDVMSRLIAKLASGDGLALALESVPRLRQSFLASVDKLSRTQKPAEVFSKLQLVAASSRPSDESVDGGDGEGGFAEEQDGLSSATATHTASGGRVAQMLLETAAATWDRQMQQAIAAAQVAAAPAAASDAAPSSAASASPPPSPAILPVASWQHPLIDTMGSRGLRVDMATAMRAVLVCAGMDSTAPPTTMEGVTVWAKAMGLRVAAHRVHSAASLLRLIATSSLVSRNGGNISALDNESISHFARCVSALALAARHVVPAAEDAAIHSTTAIVAAIAATGETYASALPPQVFRAMFDTLASSWSRASSSAGFDPANRYAVRAAIGTRSVAAAADVVTFSAMAAAASAAGASSAASALPATPTPTSPPLWLPADFAALYFAAAVLSSHRPRHHTSPASSFHVARAVRVMLETRASAIAKSGSTASAHILARTSSPLAVSSVALGDLTFYLLAEGQLWTLSRVLAAIAIPGAEAAIVPAVAATGVVVSSATASSAALPMKQITSRIVVPSSLMKQARQAFERNAGLAHLAISSARSSADIMRLLHDVVVEAGSSFAGSASSPSSNAAATTAAGSAATANVAPSPVVARAAAAAAAARLAATIAVRAPAAGVAAAVPVAPGSSASSARAAAAGATALSSSTSAPWISLLVADDAHTAANAHAYTQICGGSSVAAMQGRRFPMPVADKLEARGAFPWGTKQEGDDAAVWARAAGVGKELEADQVTLGGSSSTSPSSASTPSSAPSSSPRASVFGDAVVVCDRPPLSFCTLQQINDAARLALDDTSSPLSSLMLPELMRHGGFLLPDAADKIATVASTQPVYLVPLLSHLRAQAAALLGGIPMVLAAQTKIPVTGGGLTSRGRNAALAGAVASGRLVVALEFLDELAPLSGRAGGAASPSPPSIISGWTPDLSVLQALETLALKLGEKGVASAVRSLVSSVRVPEHPHERMQLGAGVVAAAKDGMGAALASSASRQGSSATTTPSSPRPSSPPRPRPGVARSAWVGGAGGAAGAGRRN